MLTGLIAVSVAAVAVNKTAPSVASGPPSRRRELDRRRDHLRAHPEQVNSLDVELLLAESLSQPRASQVCGQARARRIPALVLWGWTELFDAELLALAVEAGLTREELQHHLATGTSPDRRSLEIFAACHVRAA